MDAAAARAELAPGPPASCRMEEESAAPSTSADKTDSVDVDGEAKKLLGLGQKHLVLGNIPAAVNAFQEAASILGKKYGETADECAEAFFYYGKSLLELARMENGVLGNALEGVHVEEEEGEKTEDDSMVENADNIDEEAREELREQVYNAMGEKEESKKSAEVSPILTDAGKGTEREEVETKGKTREEEEVAVTETKLKLKVEEKVESDVQERAVAEVIEEQAEVAVEKETALEKQVTAALDKQEEAAVEKEAALEEQATAASDKQEEAAIEKEAVSGAQATAASDKQEEVAVEKEAVSGVQATATVQKEAGAGEQADQAVDEQIEAATEEKAVQAMEEMPNKSKEALASKETSFAAGSAEGKEPVNELQSEEKREVSAKVEKERDDVMEEGDGAKVEKGEEEKDDVMEEGEETEGSDEEDKENEKTEDDKENDSTVEDKSFQESEEDEVGNLELAWDMLELAKVIYKRQERKEAQLHAAQAHLKLGEVSIESENYAQAIEEFQACLALQQKYLEAHDRLLAESHYQLALAYHYNSQFDEAVVQFSKSVDVIDKRLLMLTERLKEAGGSTEDEKEIEELKGLLPEIKEKIEDSKESQKSARVAELALKATLVGGATSSFTQSDESCSVSAIPVKKAADGAPQCVTDISHLVRKKRKPEEETQQGDNEAKKSKPESAVNGGGDASPSGNEVAEKMEEETEKRPHVDSGAAVESKV
uniref:Nuclear autoantigenic sperm protein n=1 Tax=Pelusios castaneus TaxID=367368 RepID=A0A8C8SRQ6_9SAUR